ncbi:MAG: hypothetical protein AAGC83_12560 [Pseudomonadota bacterium]
MQQAAVPKIFADRLAHVSMANGVLRLRLVALSAENEFDPSGELVLPVKQLPKLIKDLNETAENILEKHRKESARKTRSSAKKATGTVGKRTSRRATQAA